MNRYIAAVAVHAEGLPMHADILYSYVLPPELYREHMEGYRVVVPFGKGNRKRIGMIMNVSAEGPDARKGLKKILAVADSQPVFNEEQLLLIGWLRENTFCTYYDAIRTLLPAALQLRVQEHYALSREPELAKDLSSEAAQLYAVLMRARSQKELDTLLDAQNTPEKRRAAAELTEKGILCSDNGSAVRVKGRKLRMIRLLPDAEYPGTVSVKQQQVLTALAAIRAPQTQDEYDLHGLVADALQRADIDFHHEAPLAPRCRIDFLCGTVGIEIKRGRPDVNAVSRQLRRLA